MRDFYERRFDVRLDPEREIMPALGAKEAIFNLNLAFLDPGDYALAADPGYPVYTGGPWLAGAEPVLMALRPELGFVPDLGAIEEDDRQAGEADVPELPEQPDRRGRARGVLRARGRVRARATTSWSCTTTPTRRSPTTATERPRSWPTPGAKDVGIEVFSLSKGYNMTGWRCAVVVGNARGASRPTGG